MNNNHQLKVLDTSIKHNELMQTSNYHLTVNEKQLLLNLIKRMSATSPKVKFNFKRYPKLAGLSRNKVESDQVAADLEKLNSKNFWVSYHSSNGHKDEKLLSWFTLIELDVGTGTFTVTFNHDLRTFLLHVKNRLNDDTRKLDE